MEAQATLIWRIPKYMDKKIKNIQRIYYGGSGKWEEGRKRDIGRIGGDIPEEWFVRNISWKVRNGYKVRLWHDKLMGKECLYKKYNWLFRIQRKRCLILGRWENDGNWCLMGFKQNDNIHITSKIMKRKHQSKPKPEDPIKDFETKSTTRK
ncbi:hypothetical protein CR513_63013, partial [Mucuna pruriens]